MRFQLGDGVPLQHLVTNRDGVPAAATVVLTVTAPDGTTQTPVITTGTVGTYDAATFVADQLGPWAYAWSVTGAVTDVVPGTFVVESAVDRSYVGQARLKEALGIPLTDTTRDDLLDLARDAASRVIDDMTGRRFWADPVAVSRVYTPRVYRGRHGSRLLLPDFATITELATGSGTYSAWGVGTYELTYFEDGNPDTAITGITSLGPSWPGGSGRVRITGRPGWPGVPAQVEQAGLILSARYYRRKDSPEGVTGAAEWGGIRLSRRDPDVAQLLARYTIAGIG